MEGRTIAFAEGALKSPSDPRDFVYGEVKPFKAEDLPRAYRLPEWPVRDQGKFGTCVGQACSGLKDVQETREWGKALATSPLFVYSECKKRDGIPKEEGTYPRVAMQVLRDLGICLEHTFPYSKLTDGLNVPTPGSAARTEAKKYVVKAYALVKTLDEIKAAIVRDGPVLGAVIWTSNMLEPEEGGFLNMPYGGILGGHAIAITGYDDDLTHTFDCAEYKGMRTFKGFFRVRNSWGPKWGDNGYCWMSYLMLLDLLDEMTPYIMEAWTTVDKVVNPPQPKPPAPPQPSPPAPSGEEYYFDVPPQIIDGRTMVPVRQTGVVLGARVDWNGERKEIVVDHPDKTVYMWVGQKRFIVVKK